MQNNVFSSSLRFVGCEIRKREKTFTTFLIYTCFRSACKVSSRTNCSPRSLSRFASSPFFGRRNFGSNFARGPKSCVNIFTSIWFAHGMHHLSRNAILACRLIHLSKTKRSKNETAWTFTRKVFFGRADKNIASLSRGRPDGGLEF